MKRWIVLMIFIATAAYAIKVDEKEISGSGEVQFVNKEGKGAKSDTIAEIRAIGINLATGAMKKADNEKYLYAMKYAITHCIATAETNLMAADIFSIEKSAGVNHIKNIRRILSAYLETRYEYTRKQSDALAVFLTYYNAVHRGETEYFATKFNSVVMKNVTKKNVGLSTKYYEWKGNTKMVIPLSDEGLDTKAISEDKVVDEMKKTDDKGIDERTELVKIKEDEVKKNTDKLSNTTEIIKKKMDEINSEEKKLEEEKKIIDEKKTTIEESKKDVNKIEDLNEKKKKTEEILKDEKKVKEDEKKTVETEKKIEEKKDEVKKAEEDKTKIEKKIEEKKTEIAEDKKKIDEDKAKIEDKNPDTEKTKLEEEKKKLEEEKKKLEEEKQALKDEKKKVEDEKAALEAKKDEIKKQEEKLRETADDRIYGDTFYYLKTKDFVDTGVYQNELFKIDAASSKVQLKSDYGTISGRKYDIADKGVVVIGFEGDNMENHRLVLLDKDKLKMIAKSDDVIFWRSFVEIRDEQVYAIALVQGKYYLARFDSSLKRIDISKESVDRDSGISFYGDLIYINDDSKRILALNKKDLSLVQRIAP